MDQPGPAPPEGAVPELPVPVRQEDPNAVAQYIDNVKQAPEAPYIFMDLIIKSLAPLYFFFCTRLSSNFIIIFVVTTVLIVTEFWYTKNIVGRRLTGMRWWQVPSQGTSETTWRFEHRGLDNPEYKPSKPASLQFWGGMCALVAYWLIMLILEISKPKYLILIVIALFFVLMNALGYYRCRSWSIQEMKALQNTGGGFGNVVSGLTAGMAQNFMSVMNRV